MRKLRLREEVTFPVSFNIIITKTEGLVAIHVSCLRESSVTQLINRDLEIVSLEPPGITQGKIVRI
jgi:hypothetical protein